MISGEPVHGNWTNKGGFMLSGYKTYLVSAGMVVASGLLAQGFISNEVYGILMGVLNGAGFAALRAGVAKK